MRSLWQRCDPTDSAHPMPYRPAGVGPSGRRESTSGRSARPPSGVQRRGGLTMTHDDKTSHDTAGEARHGLAASIAGKAKEVAGAVLNNDSLTREGQLQQSEAQDRREANAEEAVADASAQRAAEKLRAENEQAREEKQRAAAEEAQRVEAAQRAETQEEARAEREAASRAAAEQAAAE